MEDLLRRNNIDALRLALAMLVIFSHSYPLGTGNEASEPLALATRGQLTFGSLAVDWFFVLSGFLITQSWEHVRATGPFLLKRVKRIYPGYAVAVAVCSVVVVPLATDSSSNFTLSHAVEYLKTVPLLRVPAYPGAFLHNPYPSAVNGSLWSIPYEFWCYVGVALLGSSGLLHRRNWVLALFFATITIHFVVQVTGFSWGGSYLGLIFGYPPFWARMLPLYLSGVVFFLYRERLFPSGKLVVWALFGLAVAAHVPHGMVFAVPTLGSYVLFYLAFTRRVRLYNAARYGDFSYGVYLYAFPIQQLIVFWQGGPMDPLRLLLYALPTSLLAGALSWYGVEQHFMKSKKRTASSPASSLAGV